VGWTCIIRWNGANGVLIADHDGLGALNNLKWVGHNCKSGKVMNAPRVQGPFFSRRIHPRISPKGDLE